MGMPQASRAVKYDVVALTSCAEQTVAGHCEPGRIRPFAKLRVTPSSGSE